jgi:hypothetical protein
MADATAEILLKVNSNLEGIIKAQAAFKELQDAAKLSAGAITGAKDETEGMGASIRTNLFGSMGLGAGLGLGAAAALGVVEAIRSVTSEIKGLVTGGVMFNAEMENAKLGIAAALRTFDPERYHSFQTALQASGTVIDQLKAKSAQFGLSFGPLAEQYTATVGAMFRGGITDIQKQIDLTVILNRSMTTLGIVGTRATRDIADILNGVANRTVAGRSLGITDADLKSASEAGQLYEFLEKKLSAFGEAVNASSDNVTVLQERLKASASQGAADQTNDLTVAYKELLKSLIALTSSEAFTRTLGFMDRLAVGGVGMATAFAKFIGSNASGDALNEANASVSEFSKSASGVRSQADNGYGRNHNCRGLSRCW